MSINSLMIVRKPLAYDQPGDLAKNNPKKSLFDFGFLRSRSVTDQRRAENSIGQSEDSIQGMTGMAAVEAMRGELYGADAGYAFLPSDVARVNNAIADELGSQFLAKNQMKVRKWRAMEKLPEPNNILDHVCNQAICPDRSGNIATLDVLDTELGIALSPHVKTKIVRDFNYFMNRVVEFNKIANKVMRKYLVEGRVFLEVLYDDSIKEIVGFNILPSWAMVVVVNRGVIVGYRQYRSGGLGDSTNGTYYTGKGSDYIDYGPNQILFWDYESYGPGGLNDPLSFLDRARKVSNQLSNIEDAIVRYRILRGHEKRVFKIDISDVPPAKAEQYMRRQQQALNRKLYYSPVDGEISGTENVIGMSEDFYLPVNGSGGSTIDTLASGANLGEIQDLTYFKRKMAEALKLPFARMGGDENFSFGKSSDQVLQEEIRFDMFVDSIHQSLSMVLVRAFVMYLETKGEYDDSLKVEELFRVNFNKANAFRAFKEAEIWKMRFEQLAAAKELMWSEENTKGILSSTYVLKKIFQWSDQEAAENDQLLHEDIKEAARKHADEIKVMNGITTPDQMPSAPVSDTAPLMPDMGV